VWTTVAGVVPVPRHHPTPRTVSAAVVSAAVVVTTLVGVEPEATWTTLRPPNTPVYCRTRPEGRVSAWQAQGLVASWAGWLVGTQQCLDREGDGGARSTVAQGFVALPVRRRHAYREADR